jgi:arsenite-transporting ATPase
MLDVIGQATRIVFLTGKGGVGKTSMACAIAVALADHGRRVLLVSTDPASNLGQVFGITVDDHAPTTVPQVSGLFVLNINPEAAAQTYRDRIIGPVRGVLPADVVKGMEEQLSGACTTEIAAFDEFTELLTDSEVAAGFDHVIFDTAPTGHTLRLLQLPSAWSDFLRNNESGASCLGPLSGLEKQRQRYSQAVSELTNRQHTVFILVTRPQRSSFTEAERTSRELAALGITNQRLVINGILPDNGSDDPLATAWMKKQREAMERIPDALRTLPATEVPLQPCNLVGIDALRGLLVPGTALSSAVSERRTAMSVELPPISRLIDSIESDGHGLVMVLGKGGVGKTTIAAAIAVELASRGHLVHLTTTDPAAHLTMTVESDIPGLEVSRIDPHVEVDRYTQHVLETKGQNLDEAGRALLAEDLRSPCTEEIAVFQAFSRVMRESRDRFVVVDTAPTGHTLLLLDATGAYHRDVVRNLAPGVHVRTPMMQLQDPAQTKMLIVTLPETTPVLEAEGLQNDLRRAGIEPWAWVINSSLAAAAPTDPLLAARADAERTHIDVVRRKVERVAVVPWLVEEPAGRARLQGLAHSVETRRSLTESECTTPAKTGSEGV